jgi:hypothetical protein
MMFGDLFYFILFEHKWLFFFYDLIWDAYFAFGESGELEVYLLRKSFSYEETNAACMSISRFYDVEEEHERDVVIWMSCVAVNPYDGFRTRQISKRDIQHKNWGNLDGRDNFCF